MSVGIADEGIVASQAAMLALTDARQGDWCFRTDQNKSYRLTGTDPTNVAHWTVKGMPSGVAVYTDAVTSTTRVDRSDEVNTILSRFAFARTTAARLMYADGSVPGGNTVGNTTAETAFASSHTIPANRLAVGMAIRITLAGRYSTDVIAPTIRIRVKIGGTTAADTGSVTATAALSNSGWQANFFGVITAIGVGGSIECFCPFTLATAATTVQQVENSQGSISIDTTGTLAITVTAQWGTAHASNTITLRTMAVEIAG